MKCVAAKKLHALQLACALPALLGLSVLVAGCQPALKPRGETQTIGSLLERNGQNPDRLFMKKLPPKKIADADAEGRRVEMEALNHYQQVLSLDSAPGVRAEAMRRSADLRIEAAGRDGDVNMQEVAAATAMYKRLIAEFPDYPNKDHVIYQLARAYELSGRSELAINTLRDLAHDYPQSQRANDALFRSAEMLYLRKRYQEAADEYGRLISQNPAMPYWQMAQYKYAWSQYQLSKPELAVGSFTAILSQLKTLREVTSVDQLLTYVPEASAELVRDTVRGLSLALAAKADGHNIAAYFAKLPGNHFYPLVYNSLGELLLSKKRYTDAASVFDAFASAYPQHELAMSHSEKAIAAYQQGGFTGLKISAQEAYVERYAADLLAAQASGAADAELPKLSSLLRDYTMEILAFRHAEAQQTPVSEADLRLQRFAAVAASYRKALAMFPNDSDFATTSMRYADALFDGGEVKAAADQYMAVAYDLPSYSKPADAALASVKSYRAWLKNAPEAERDAAQQAVIAASTRMAAAFPQHPERSRVLLASAEDLYVLQRHQEAIAIAEPLLVNAQWTEPSLQSKALSITADAYFAQNSFDKAEMYYAKLLPMIAGEPELQRIAKDRLAVSVYRRAEGLRADGDSALAANLFLRAADLSPDPVLRANASFDAAGQLYAVNNWKQTADVLQRFRSEFPNHEMAGDADKLLAETYQKSAQPALAAGVYARIALVASETLETRRQASLMAAKLYDQAGLREQARVAIENHIAQFPAPLLEAQQFRQRLAEMAPANSELHHRWLKEIITADKLAAQPIAASQLLAADASLQLAMIDVRRANSAKLRLPIAKSLPLRQRAMQTAIDSLAQASAYGFSDITTKASYELGNLYRDFAKALMASEKPRELRGEVLEAYALLLEEQAYPFEEKAISAFEANVARVRDGVWTAGMRQSLFALIELAPAKYGKQPQLEDSYDSLY
ncbi:MAG: tetratricopeptide repeat protein [Zhongshania sp.]|uniref:tetratricopeptide repeat protein n=1 Tax=Zhongshania sp. TaxID=1971902 RepID=UPI00261B9875|nr:tetratricopeptide repeat protein [Zhongshania sp.]MDF1691226.1 tetratricopeptide repeat protein [Zhongshania sp.]